MPLAGSPPFISPENKENRPLPFMHIGSVLGVLNSSNSQLENLLFWRDYYGDDENCKFSIYIIFVLFSFCMFLVKLVKLLVESFLCGFYSYVKFIYKPKNNLLM